MDPSLLGLEILLFAFPKAKTWAPEDENANNFPVNDVKFQGFSDLRGFSSGPTFDNGYDNFGSPNTPDSNYNMLLQYGRFSNEGLSPASLSWAGMTPGHIYQVQVWVNDGRNIGETRSETIRGGTNTSAALSFGSDDTLFLRAKSQSTNQSLSGSRHYLIRGSATHD